VCNALLCTASMRRNCATALSVLCITCAGPSRTSLSTGCSLAVTGKPRPYWHSQKAAYDRSYLSCIFSCIFSCCGRLRLCCCFICCLLSFFFCFLSVTLSFTLSHGAQSRAAQTRSCSARGRSNHTSSKGVFINSLRPPCLQPTQLQRLFFAPLRKFATRVVTSS
jgi:hypothetical protein